MSYRCLVSVIIPIYNTGPFLKQCIDSVINQTVSDCEIILVDDGSTDESNCISNGYICSDERITLISKPNGGQSSARNRALDIAVGKYIYFLDSDDYIEPTLLHSLVDIAERETADVVFFDAVSFFDGEMSEDEKRRNEFCYCRKNHYPKRNGCEQYLSLAENNEYYVCTPLHLYRRSYLENSLIRFREGIVFEDNLFSADIYVSNGVIVQSKENGYQRRVRRQSTMTSADEEALLHKYQSKAIVYYETSYLLKRKNPANDVHISLIMDCLESVLCAYSGLPANLRQRVHYVDMRIRYHAFFIYGRKSDYIARRCSGGITNLYVRAIQLIKRKLCGK